MGNEKTGIPENAALAEEYAQFAYIVSHDLGAPLRHMREFSRLLLESLDQPLNDRQRRYGDMLRKSVQRAEAMIDGLLQFSRLNTQQQPLAPLSSENALAEAQKELEQKIGHTGAAIARHAPLPEITGDRQQIVMLFKALLDNAMTYAREGISPEITITAEHQQEHWLFSLRDNGIGMEPGNAEHVFTILRRLHDNAPGAGVGLTLARRIVHRHGGRIWINSIPNQGTTVCFTLAKEPLAKNQAFSAAA